MRGARTAALFFVAPLAGCLDFGVPDKPPPDLGPTVQFVSPQDGSKIGLIQFLQLNVTSFHAITQMSVYCSAQAGQTCGGELIQEWRQPAPYEATVDLSNCAIQLGGGGNQVTAELCAKATDDQSVVGLAQISVTLDLSAPQLTVQGPTRITANSTLTLQIHSDRPLQSLPVVRMEGLIGVVTGDLNAGLFQATLSPTPGLGVDVYDAGGADADVPIEVLEQVERPLDITVDARGINDNPSHVDYAMTLSRVLWDQPVPGIITAPQDAGFLSGIDCVFEPIPAGANGGLQLPLFSGFSSSVTGKLGSTCVTGFMSAVDGTFSPMPDALGDGGSVIGYDGSGRSVLLTGLNVANGVLNVSALAPKTNAPGPSAASPFSNVNNTALVPVGADTTCQTQSPAFGPPMCTSVACFSADGSLHPSLVAATSSYVPEIELSSGDTYFSYSDGFTGCIQVGNCPCGLSQVVLGKPGALVGISPPPFSGSLSQALPIDGGFIVTYNAGATFPVTATGMLTNTGTLTGVWSSPPLIPSAAFPDGRLLTIEFFNADGYTVLKGWDANAGTYAVSSRVPGPLFPTATPGAGNTTPVGPRGYVASANRLAILVLTSLPPSPSVGVLVLDHAMQPKWLYRYPEFFALPQYLRLVSDPGSQVVYLVDLANERVVALPLQ